MRELARMGRFLEPAVRRAVKLSREPAVRASGEELLAAYARR
jgi:hypothetical protein